uniref:Immunoglobulin V-set domain-containing protein n=1 Tax=Rhinolophus ferrumequinum TaxID=59479 RepID=A0A671FG75_RHIFE
MKYFHLFMGLAGMKRPQDSTFQPRSLRSTRPVSVPTMAWTVLLLGLLAYGSGVDSQTVVTQEPLQSVSPGGTVTLTCGLSSGSVSTGYYPSWYQQTPGRSPRMLIYSTNYRPSGVPSRFSGSISGNKAALTITGASLRTRLTITVLCIWVRLHFHTDANPWGSSTKTSTYAQ